MTPTQHQQLFDKIYYHLLCQRKRSTVGDPVLPDPIYGRDGLRNVEGILINRQHYSLALEDEPFCSDLIMEAITKSLQTCFDYKARGLLQDFYFVYLKEQPKHWHACFVSIAWKHGLRVPPKPTLFQRFNYWLDRQIEGYWDGLEHHIV